MQKKAFTLIEILAIVAIVSTLSSILFPVLSQRRKSKITNKPNLENLAKGARLYGGDYDDLIPILANGPTRSLTNTADGSLTVYGEQRTDQWPLLVLPYADSRADFQDPRRDDLYGIWSAPAHATSEAGFTALGASYRNQNKFPCFGVNYLFLSPMESIGGDATNTRAIAKAFAQATEPSKTIFYLPSMRGGIRTSENDTIGQLDTVRGFFVVNAPGMGRLGDQRRTIIYHNGVACSLDWCKDALPSEPGNQKATNFAYIERVLKGNNVAFLDGHVKFMRDGDMAAGTNYSEAVAHGEGNLLGAVITDKRKYLWDLNGDFYGLYR